MKATSPVRLHQYPSSNLLTGYVAEERYLQQCNINSEVQTKTNIANNPPK